MRDFSDKSDESLVTLFINGDSAAFEELYMRYAPRLRRFIQFYAGESDEAEDILHEVFIRCIRHAGTFKVDMSFSAWIYKIAVNCSKNYMSQRMRSENLVEREKVRINSGGNYYESPESVFIDGADLEYFRKAVDGLKDKFKEVFVLRYDQEMKYGEISKVLNCSERTAKWRMKKAVESIAYYLMKNNVV